MYLHDIWNRVTSDRSDDLTLFCVRDKVVYAWWTCYWVNRWKNYLTIWSDNGVLVFLCYWYVKNIACILVSSWIYRLILSDFLLGGFGAIHEVIPWGPCHLKNSFIPLFRLNFKVCLMFQFNNLKEQNGKERYESLISNLFLF